MWDKDNNTERIKFKHPPCISNKYLTLKNKTKMNKVQVPELNGFAAIGNKLIACKLAKAIIVFHKKFNDNGDIIGCTQEVTELAVEDVFGNVLELSPAKYFESEDDYKNNKPCEYTQAVWLGNYLRTAEFTETKNIAHLIEDNNVVSREFYFTEMIIFFDTKENAFSFVKGIQESDVPSGSYATREEALAHLDYEVIDKNGGKKKCIGIANLLKLDAQQSEVVSEIAELMKKARGLGVSFIADNTNSTINAINTNNVASICPAYNRDCETYYDIVNSVSFDMGVEVSYVSFEDVLEYKLK